MSMKICKECGASVSSGAKACPNCGKDQRIFFAKHKFITFILILLIIIIIAVNSGDDSTSGTTLTSGNSTGVSSSVDENKIYSVGEIYQDGNIAIKYVSLNSNFTDYSEYAEVKSGYKVIQAEFEAENLGTSDELFSSYDFNCYADGYDCEAFWSVDDSTFSSNLSSGKKAKGCVYFTVSSDAQEIVIEYSLNMFTNEKIKFKVN